MKKLNPRAVIFDLGSTLLEYETIPWPELGKKCNASAQAFLQKQGFQVPGLEEFDNAFEEVKEISRQQAREEYIEWSVPQVTRVLFNNLGIEYNDDFVDDFFSAYYEPVERELFIYDDVIDSLEGIKGSIPSFIDPPGGLAHFERPSSPALSLYGPRAERFQPRAYRDGRTVRSFDG